MRLDDARPDPDAALALYEAVGWTVYARDPARLARAFEGSTFVTCAYEAERLVGLARVISDDASIWLLQDLLVDPEHQRGGVGRRLVERCRERFAHVGRALLLTDARGPRGFYERVGFSPAPERSLAAYVALE